MQTMSDKLAGRDLKSHPFVNDVEPVCASNLLDLAKQKKRRAQQLYAPVFRYRCRAAFDAFIEGILEPVFVGERA